tara:strand:+ start:31841 stop:33094 length:1254 start_codon:yes stop_codon:yes gene_type:complete
MDKLIQKKKRPLWQWMLLGVAGVGVAWSVQAMLADASIRTYRVNLSQLVVSDVLRDAFDDVTPIRGTIQPFSSVFLDAVNGGVVEEVLAEEGSFVEAGQPLLQLSNNDLQLQVANNDTQTTEQINNLANISNSMDTTRLMTERAIIDTDYSIIVLKRQKERMEKLISSNMISKEEYDAIADELLYRQKIHANLLERQELEDRIRQERMTQIEGQMVKLQDNLGLSLRTFADLLVRAPVAGQLTSLPVEIGENKSRGQRLGQIDAVDQYKIVAQVDEYYVTRVALGQSARFILAGEAFNAKVMKVYPEITAGTFEIDLSFEGEAPSRVRRGQTLQLDLTLGNPVESLLLPLGGFIQDTGGNWVFVLNEAGEFATRRGIVTGRRNSRYMEVREGLEVGDRVITSSYSNMGEMERIQLTP